MADPLQAISIWRQCFNSYKRRCLDAALTYQISFKEGIIKPEILFKKTLKLNFFIKCKFISDIISLKYTIKTAFKYDKKAPLKIPAKSPEF